MIKTKNSLNLNHEKQLKNVQIIYFIYIKVYIQSLILYKKTNFLFLNR